jgi:SpoVK/Ycf46/Vps4 family AAA+-type ATPase
VSTSKQLLALLKTHLRGDEEEFLSIAMQVAAREARLGHSQVAEEIRNLIDEAKSKSPTLDRRSGSVLILQPRSELANLLSIQQPTIRLSNMVLGSDIETRLRRVILEYRQQRKLRQHGLKPRRKLLFTGQPGTGKTMTAAALSGELHLPLFTILLEGLITKFMGDTAAKLRVVFDTIAKERGVFFFDEFDAIGARRSHANDVGEIRRVLNSFLQFVEKDDSESLIIAATNHADLLDPALFRRFDDVLEYSLPDKGEASTIVKSRLSSFNLSQIDWDLVIKRCDGLSQADLSRASDDAAKKAVLGESREIATTDLVAALQERRRTRL